MSIASRSTTTHRTARPLLQALLAALALSACGSPEDAGTVQEPSMSLEAGQPSTASPPSAAPSAPDAGAVLTASVSALLAAQPIAAAGSEGWRAPTGLELRAFEASLRELLATPDSADARAALAQQGFTVRSVRDVGGAQLLLVTDAKARGAGSVVLNLTPARDLWLEAPHATSDLGTGTQAARLLTSLGARALVLTGADRCATAALTPCTSGVTAACGGQLRASDAAHNTDTFFTAAHRALRAAFPRTPALSVHGFETLGSEAAILSDGTRTPAPAGALVLRLRDALAQRVSAGVAVSCNDPADSGYRALCATTNVQGRIDNGAGDACVQGTASASGLFLHMEQAPALRRAGAEQDAVERALMATFGCSLAGPAQGCATAAADVP